MDYFEEGTKLLLFFLSFLSFPSFLFFFYISTHLFFFFIIGRNKIFEIFRSEVKDNKIARLSYQSSSFLSLSLQPEETVQLPIPERLAELGMVNSQVAYHVRLLVVLHRAVGALEPGRLLALVPQMGEHRLLPLVEVATTRALVHPVPPHDSEHAAGTGVESLHLRSLFHTPIWNRYTDGESVINGESSGNQRHLFFSPFLFFLNESSCQVLSRGSLLLLLPAEETEIFEEKGEQGKSRKRTPSSFFRIASNTFDGGRNGWKKKNP